MKAIAIFSLLVTSLHFSNFNFCYSNSGTASDSLLPGRYGPLSIGLDENEVITGVYQYYNDWDDKRKGYVQIQVFYIYGKKVNDSSFSIKTRWPNEDKVIKGKIIFSNRYLKLILDDNHDGYADHDFRDPDDFKRSLTKRIEWQQVRLVKSISHFYALPNDTSQKMSYLVSGDVVKVITTDGNWSKIEYNPINNNAKSYVGWIKEETLYPEDSSLW